ncbi:TFIIH basal transcription factor complex helicase XPB subunit [Cyanidiococcus yangmingshanensis]|uniref:DNA 3'-5' helicase n=1 Tax=Cyanidiococcus yangmingshanensis TaxID=2690220 RepID=A0A7J7IGZ8_9RHOD|nr:TFIIH basal transcription factor complex helicase XPB subunit [Cyanidiococcus yangmingshanensis]
MEVAGSLTRSSVRRSARDRKRSLRAAEAALDEELLLAHLDDDLEDLLQYERIDDDDEDSVEDVDYKEPSVATSTTKLSSRSSQRSRRGHRSRRGPLTADSDASSLSSSEWTSTFKRVDKDEQAANLRAETDAAKACFRVPTDLAEIAALEQAQLATPLGVDYTRTLNLKVDHVQRPIWVLPNGRIFLEAFSPIYRQASDFLVAIAEPASRPEWIHEYLLTPYSLYAAVSVGLETEAITTVLERLCKTDLPISVTKLIEKCTRTYGKAKLVLHRNRYYVQSPYPEVLRFLLQDEKIAKARVHRSDETDEFGRIPSEMLTAQVDALPWRTKSLGTEPERPVEQSRETVIHELERRLEGDASTDEADDLDCFPDRHRNSNAPQGHLHADDEDQAVAAARELGLDEDMFQERSRFRDLLSFEVHPMEVDQVKRRCLELDYPLLEEYDFRNDTLNASITIDLKPQTHIRPYQEKSLAKMFGNGRARSGVIVLPCGAGKTLVGVTASCTIKKTCLILCTSAVSVEQWRHQLLLWSTIEEQRITRFTAEQRPSLLGDITITTYTMVAFGGRRSVESERLLQQIREREWGLMILDEVHVVPANMFRKVLGIVKAHSKLGLTATLVREDLLITDINFLIGPKLYEANWLDLQRQGYLATVQCAEVWCPMTAEFYREYLQRGSAKRRLLYAMNPHKFRSCEFLMKFHESRGDKVIIFSDNIFALRYYATLLRRPFIYGPTSQTERMRILTQFQRNPVCNTIMLSKVGDTSIDLPEANVIIQISGQYGSRRQEAQRLGRILRPKPRPDQNFNAFYYSLVSTDTSEVYFATKRQQFLVDQGYAFKVIAHIPEMDSSPSTGMPDKESELNALAAVLAAEDSEGADTTLADELQRRRLAHMANAPLPKARRVIHSGAQALSGAQNLLYGEFARTVTEHATEADTASMMLERRVVQHPLFRKRRRQLAAAKRSSSAEPASYP